MLIFLYLDLPLNVNGYFHLFKVVKLVISPLRFLYFFFLYVFERTFHLLFIKTCFLTYHGESIKENYSRKNFFQ
jgi:hypothetical protein